jgi:hypothetical protein
VTPTLSVAASQVRSARCEPPVAVRFGGAVGASVSAVGTGTVAIRATDGTPLSLTIQSRYAPGGTARAFAGPSTCSVDPLRVKLSGT